MNIPADDRLNPDDLFIPMLDSNGLVLAQIVSVFIHFHKFFILEFNVGSCLVRDYKLRFKCFRYRTMWKILKLCTDYEL